MINEMIDEMNITTLDESNDQEMHLNGDEVNIHQSGSYIDLMDKPTLNGKTILGDMEETDPTVPSWAKTPTRQVYTADDVGAIGKNDLQEIGIIELENLWEEL